MSLHEAEAFFSVLGEMMLNNSSYQQLAQLHEVKHVGLVHLSQLFAQLNGLLPHLRIQAEHSFKQGEGRGIRPEHKN